MRGLPHCLAIGAALTVSAVFSAVGLAAEKGGSWSFSAEERQRIDDGALWSAREKVNIAQVEAYGSALQWLVARTPLPIAEEVVRAKKQHNTALDKYKTSEAPVRAQTILNQLVDTLPARMRPTEYEYTLTVVDQKDIDTFTVGGGRIYVSQHVVDAALREDHPTGEDQLAFMLAHEMGHLCLGHVRRVYQRQWLHEQISQDVDADPEEKAKAKRFLDNLQGVGVILEYAHSREDNFYADLFAVQLCRNAGFNVENGLDVLRRAAVKQDRTLLNDPSPRKGDPPVEPEVQKAVTGEQFTLAEPPSPSHRLRRLRLELDGLIYGDEYGLFELDRETNQLKPAADQCIAGSERTVVCIHGMESSLEVYLPLMKQLADNDADKKFRILGFCYPADESLARSAKFLVREMQRVCEKSDHVDFICHSAGGLVLRHYIEIDSGKFHRAYFQGTPHHGSDLAALRSLLEVVQFIGDLNLGYDAALAKAIRDGHGQMSHDLLPHSLFLAHLNSPRDNLPRDRYVIYRGRAFSRARVFLLKAAVEAAATSIASTLDKESQENTGTLFARAAIAKLVLPDEIADGDLCVTSDSALLDGVEFIHDFRLNHTALPRDPETIEDLVRRVVADK